MSHDSLVLFCEKVKNNHQNCQKNYRCETFQYNLYNISFWFPLYFPKVHQSLFVILRVAPLSFPLSWIDLRTDFIKKINKKTN